MKKLHILLGCADRRSNSLIEATLRDLCFEQADLELTKVSRLDEFARHASFAGYNLLLLAADDLLPSSKKRVPPTLEEALDTIATIHSRQSTPLMTLRVPARYEVALLEAGAVAALPAPLDMERLRTEVRQTLRIYAPVPEARPSAWQWAEAFFRGFQRTRQA